MRDCENGGGKPVELQGYVLELVAPWRVRMSPYPFGESPASFELLRRVLPKNGPAEVLATPTERVAISIEG